MHRKKGHQKYSIFIDGVFGFGITNGLLDINSDDSHHIMDTCSTYCIKRGSYIFLAIQTLRAYNFGFMKIIARVTSFPDLQSTNRREMNPLVHLPNS